MNSIYIFQHVQKFPTALKINAHLLVRTIASNAMERKNPIDSGLLILVNQAMVNFVKVRISSLTRNRSIKNIKNDVPIYCLGRQHVSYPRQQVTAAVLGNNKLAIVRILFYFNQHFEFCSPKVILGYLRLDLTITSNFFQINSNFRLFSICRTNSVRIWNLFYYNFTLITDDMHNTTTSRISGQVNF